MFSPAELRRCRLQRTVISSEEAWRSRRFSQSRDLLAAHSLDSVVPTPRTPRGVEQPDLDGPTQDTNPWYSLDLTSTSPCAGPHVASA